MKLASDARHPRSATIYVCIVLFLFLLASACALAQQCQASPSKGTKIQIRTSRLPVQIATRRLARVPAGTTRIDLSPPKDDAKDHPNSTLPELDAGEDARDVQEVHPYDPHRAAKDIEVGDFYFKKKNYRAALDRYREALFYKNNDALANFRMAQSFEKLNQSDEAVEHYQQYLKILPNGPLSEEAKKALEKLKAGPASAKTRPSSKDLSDPCHPERVCSFRLRKEHKSKDPYCRSITSLAVHSRSDGNLGSVRLAGRDPSTPYLLRYAKQTLPLRMTECLFFYPNKFPGIGVHCHFELGFVWLVHKSRAR